MRMNCWTAKVTRYRFINLVGHDLSEKEKNDDNNSILYNSGRSVGSLPWPYEYIIMIL